MARGSESVDSEGERSPHLIVSVDET